LTGSRLDEGRGRGSAATQLLVVHQRGAAHNSGGGAGNRRRETTPGVGQAGPNGLMTRVGKENARKKIKQAAKEFWAGLEMG
jgi:hypothetical protein